MCAMMRWLQFGILSGWTFATPLNMTVLDQSPTIRYLPDRGVGKPRWQTNYQQNNPANYTRGALGRGSSSHFTENIGSGFTFNFKGTSIYIYGSAREDAYTMTISDSGLAGAEGRRMQPVGGTTPLLGWIDGLEDKWWTIDCNVTASTGFTITSIDFTVNIGPDKSVFSAITGLPRLCE